MRRMSFTTEDQQEITVPATRANQLGGHQLLDRRGVKPDDRHPGSARKCFDGLVLAQQLRGSPAGSPHNLAGGNGLAQKRTDLKNDQDDCRAGH